MIASTFPDKTPSFFAGCKSNIFPLLAKYNLSAFSPQRENDNNKLSIELIFLQSSCISEVISIFPGIIVLIVSESFTSTFCVPKLTRAVQTKLSSA